MTHFYGCLHVHNNSCEHDTVYTCTMYVLFRLVVGLHLVLFTQYNVYNSVSVAYICIIFSTVHVQLESSLYDITNICNMIL